MEIMISLKKLSKFPGASKVVNLRIESIIATLLQHHNSLLHPKSYCYTHILLPPFIKEASLYRRWRPLKKITSGYKIEIN